MFAEKQYYTFTFLWFSLEFWSLVIALCLANMYTTTTAAAAATTATSTSNDNYISKALNPSISDLHEVQGAVHVQLEPSKQKNKKTSDI